MKKTKIVNITIQVSVPESYTDEVICQLNKFIKNSGPFNMKPFFSSFSKNGKTQDIFMNNIMFTETKVVDHMRRHKSKGARWYL